MTSTNKIGKIAIPEGVSPELHELETAKVLASHGYDIEFLVPVRAKGFKTPDIVMDGNEWELKSPTGKSRNGIQRIIRRAVLQSGNIVIDLRRSRLNQAVALREIKHQIMLSHDIAKIVVVTKTQKLLNRHDLLLY